MKRTILVAAALSLVLFTGGMVGCSGDDDGPGAVPRGGLWVGTNMQFNVSADGSMITAEGSSLRRGANVCSMIAGSAALGITTCFGTTLPIDDGKFSYRDGAIDIDGKFDTPTSASGDLTLAPPGGNAVSSSWTAGATK